MITNIQAVEYAKKAIGREYWYGTFANKATKSLLEYKRKQYPQYYDRSKYNRGWTCDGQPVYDCIGLAVKGPIFCNGVYGAEPKYNAAQDVSANGMRKLCKKTGKMSTLPEVPGVLLFRDGHIGIYEGNGYAIEAKGHNYGVCRTKVSSGGWTSWGYCPWFEYVDTAALNDAITAAFQAAKKEEQNQQQVKPATTPATPSFTHSVLKPLNVRKGPGVLYKKAKYADFPEYIKKQMSNQDYLPAGVKLIKYANKNGWYKIDKNKELYVAGNYCTKI